MSHRPRLLRAALANQGQSAVGGGFLPPDVPDLAAWFRKGTGIVEAGTFVSEWTDQSGNGNNYLQPTGTKQPVSTLAGIHFPGTDENLKTAPFTLSQPWTRYFRLQQVAWTLGAFLCDGNAFQLAALRQLTATPEVGAMAGTIFGQNADILIGQFFSIAIVFNGVSSVFQVGSSVYTGNCGANNAGGLTLGCRGDGLANFSNIIVAEEIDYAGAHDLTTRNQLIAYMDTL